MKKNKWMTEFYGKDWYEVESSPAPARELNNCLVEWRIDVREVKEVQKAQKLGFELVESFIEFETDIDPEEYEDPEISTATESDLEAILDITRVCLAENDRFYSRLKNETYFTKAQCEEYYRKTVLNNFRDEDTVTVVARVGGEAPISGYYMIRRLDSNVYKGILTAVLPESRGMDLHRRMQKACFDAIGDPFTVLNTTQLHNMHTIRNHMKENRTLSKIEHIFYLDL